MPSGTDGEVDRHGRTTVCASLCASQVRRRAVSSGLVRQTLPPPANANPGLSGDFGVTATQGRQDSNLRPSVLELLEESANAGSSLAARQYARQRVSAGRLLNSAGTRRGGRRPARP